MRSAAFFIYLLAAPAKINRLRLKVALDFYSVSHYFYSITSHKGPDRKEITNSWLEALFRLEWFDLNPVFSDQLFLCRWKRQTYLSLETITKIQVFQQAKSLISNSCLNVYQELLHMRFFAGFLTCNFRLRCNRQKFGIVTSLICRLCGWKYETTAYLLYVFPVHNDNRIQIYSWRTGTFSAYLFVFDSTSNVFNWLKNIQLWTAH